MSYDASNRKQVRAREKEAAIASANRLAYVRRIMSDQAGREWMHALLERCNIFHTPFAQVSDITAFNCGQQNIGLQLFNDVVNSSPTEYVLMMQEANIKELLNERRNSDQRSPDPATGERSEQSEPGRFDQGSITTEYEPGPEDPGDGPENTTH